MAEYFDTKIFNPEVFGKYVDTIPNTNLNELLKSGAIKRDGRLKALFAPQTGSYKGTLPIFGRLDGEPVNYDGVTDIDDSTPDTYSQQYIVTGRAKGFREKDFSSDITGGVPFMDRVAMGVSEYWADIYQAGLLHVLNGIFGMTTTGGAEFVEAHTTEIDDTFGATTLNTALQKASGDAKNGFSIAIMHSKVATDLENLQLLEYLKYTDKQGIQRNLAIGTLNGRTVLVDDGMPVDATSGKYTTYVLGAGAITFEDVGATVPYEMWRDPKTNGGETVLYTRKRYIIAPDGISFVGATASHSPTDAELEDGANWDLVSNSTNTLYYPHKKIAIARILSL